jgi:hypothetical protein
MSYCCPLTCSRSCPIVPPACGTTAELEIGTIPPLLAVSIQLELVGTGVTFSIPATSNGAGLLKINMFGLDAFKSGNVLYLWIDGIPITPIGATDTVDCIKIIIGKIQLDTNNNAICPLLQQLSLQA